jgi:hypothetical protein
MEQASAIHVEDFENMENRFEWLAFGFGPTNNVKVFLAGLQAVEDRHEELLLILELAEEESEITTIEFRPKAFSLQMLKPFGTQITGPVIAHPFLNRRLAEIISDLLTLDPFELGFFFATVFVNATLGNHLRHTRRVKECRIRAGRIENYHSDCRRQENSMPNPQRAARRGANSSLILIDESSVLQVTLTENFLHPNKFLMNLFAWLYKSTSNRTTNP